VCGKYFEKALLSGLTDYNLKDRIPIAIAKTDQLFLQNVWHEVEYSVDVCRATSGKHIELSYGIRKTFCVALYNGMRFVLVWLLLFYQ